MQYRRSLGVLLDWLETAALDKIDLVPESRGNPWGETLAAIIKMKKQGGKANMGCSTAQHIVLRFLSILILLHAVK